jgi:hypothetical protein
MKKIKWAVMIVAALSIMFAGCTGPFVDVFPGNNVAPGKKFIKLSGRTNSWDSVDISGGQWEKNDTVNVYVSAGATGFKISNNDGGVTFTHQKQSFDSTTDKYTAKLDKDGLVLAKGIRFQADAGEDYSIYEIELVGKYKLSTDAEFQGLPVGVTTALNDAGTTWLEKAGSPVITVAVR